MLTNQTDVFDWCASAERKTKTTEGKLEEVFECGVNCIDRFRMGKEKMIWSRCAFVQCKDESKCHAVLDTMIAGGKHEHAFLQRVTLAMTDSFFTSLTKREKRVFDCWFLFTAVPDDATKQDPDK